MTPRGLWLLSVLALGAGCDDVRSERGSTSVDGAVGAREGDGAAIVGRRSIASIQGLGHLSALADQRVEDVRGVVTYVDRRGFRMQDPEGDGDDRSSEALLVFTGARPEARIGDLVSVDGTVREFYPGGRDTGNLSTTEIVEPRVRVLAKGRPLPAPVVVGRGGRQPPRRVICDDAVGEDVESAGTPFDPEDDGIDFWESLEGMRVEIRRARLTGPSDDRKEFWVVPDDGIDSGPWTGRGGLLLCEEDEHPERVRVWWRRSPDMKVGDRLERVVGVLDYGYGTFRVIAEGEARPEASDLAPEVSSLAATSAGLVVGTYNVENLDPGDSQRLVVLGRHVARALRSPDILGLQEVQDANGSEQDDVVDGLPTFRALTEAIVAAGGPRYEVAQVDPRDDADGGQPGGNIRCGFLYRADRVRLVTRSGTRAGDFASPGRFGVEERAFQRSRKPLIAEFSARGRSVAVINLHLASKYGSPPIYGRRQPAGDGGAEKRRAQAEVVRRFVLEARARRPDLHWIILGDLNDFEFRAAPRLLELDGALRNAHDRLPPEERYTYNWQGHAQVLDHILVDARLFAGLEADVVHVNSEFPGAASDHDPVLVRLPEW